MGLLSFLKEDDLTPLRDAWQSRWEAALEAWSRFTKLTPPRWCLDAADEKKEGLSGSFAMIRLLDHAVVISLRQVKELGLEKFGVEIMAHEIGHHVYAPADLADNARLIARTKIGLPTRESLTGLVANLYTDLLINDRLQRSAGLDMAGVYRKLKPKEGRADRLWTMYMRLYEGLWGLPPGDLTSGPVDDQIRTDANLGARLVRAYAKDWLDGAGRFAALCLPYLLELPEKKALAALPPWMDAQEAGAGDVAPDGLVEIDEAEAEGALHPANDPDLSGLGDSAEKEEKRRQEHEAGQTGRAQRGGRKTRYRSPSEYADLMKSVGVQLSEAELVIQYYRERARPHLIRFPVREIREAADPLPEGLDVWDVGSPVSNVDWLETIIRGPHVIPGVTTVERTYGFTEGGQPERRPMDLYLGVDCSGSMGNPAYDLSYPVLSGTIIVLSALRAGARVMVTLSGEPGEYSSTDGFIRDEHEILKVLTGYLGTGYAFGIKRLEDAFLLGEKPKRPVHIMVVTDFDIFSMLEDVKNGWEIARRSLEVSGAGGTMILNIPGSWRNDARIQKLRDQGWNVHMIASWEDMVAFARAFSKMHYEKAGQPPAAKAKT